MIVLLTDFGLEGPYIGQVAAVLHRQAPGVPVVNLFSDLPPFDIRAAAYLLPAYTGRLPPGTVCLCVVDPGVGGDRPGCAVVAVRFFTFTGVCTAAALVVASTLLSLRTTSFRRLRAPLIVNRSS